MKLSVSYNLYDGEELLEGSISQIRHLVDHISVIYQDVSNFGIKRNSLKPFLQDLKNRGLIDDFFLFVPNLHLKAHKNEILKRNLGLILAKNRKMTHFISCDTDEYYIPEQFNRAKIIIEQNNYDASYCQMQTFYKSWRYKIFPPEEYYVPFIFKILPNRKHKKGRFELLVDPTRNMPSENYYIFKREELEMMHGSYIRNDIRAKLQNSSARKNFNHKISELSNYFNTWAFPKDALLAGVEERFYNVVDSGYKPLNVLENFHSKLNISVTKIENILFLLNKKNQFLNLFVKKNKV